MVLQEMERQYANIHLVALVEKHGTKHVSFFQCNCVMGSHAHAHVHMHARARTHTCAHTHTHMH